MLEKCIHSQIYSYFEDNDLFTTAQFGFRKNTSTQNAIALFLDDIYEGINTNQNCLATYIDLKKAFDTVHHNILIEKLIKYGLSDSVIKLLKNYLNDRFQRVVANGSLSKPLPVSTGVPQGSSLGPLLFLIYINDLVSVVKNSQTLLFADDTVIYNISNSVTKCQHEMQYDLDLVGLWCRENLLQVNVTKTKSMFISYKRKTAIHHTANNGEINLSFDGSMIEFVNEYKYLGVWIDSQLSFCKHIKSIIKNVSFKLSKLSKIRDCLSKKTLC